MGKKIYPDEYAALLVSRAGQQYLSFNKMESLVFFDAWCANCQFVDQCKIGSRGGLFLGSLCADGENHDLLQYGQDGQPCCVMYQEEAD